MKKLGLESLGSSRIRKNQSQSHFKIIQKSSLRKVENWTITNIYNSSNKNVIVPELLQTNTEPIYLYDT